MLRSATARFSLLASLIAISAIADAKKPAISIRVSRFEFFQRDDGTGFFPRLWFLVTDNRKTTGGVEIKASCRSGQDRLVDTRYPLEVDLEKLEPGESTQLDELGFFLEKPFKAAPTECELTFFLRVDGVYGGSEEVDRECWSAGKLSAGRCKSR